MWRGELGQLNDGFWNNDFFINDLEVKFFKCFIRYVFWVSSALFLLDQGGNDIQDLYFLDKHFQDKLDKHYSGNNDTDFLPEHFGDGLDR